MNYTIIDVHAHLWLRQDTTADDLSTRMLEDSHSLFMGGICQMLPPFVVDGVNSAEIFLPNMGYAQVSAAIVTQELIDGIQNDYLKEVATRYPDRFFVCGMCEFREPGYLRQAERLIDNNLKTIKIPAYHLLLKGGRVMPNCEGVMQMFGLTEEWNIVLSIGLVEGSTQIAEMEETITQYPRLKIAIGHFGMVALSKWKQRTLLARHPNVMIGSGGIAQPSNEEFCPFKGAMKATHGAADPVGMEKLVWKSGYSRMIITTTYKMSYDFTTKSPELTEPGEVLFLGRNARNFYGSSNLYTLPYIKNVSGQVKAIS